MSRESLPQQDLEQIAVDVAAIPFREAIVGGYVPEVHDARTEESIVEQAARVRDYELGEERQFSNADRQWGVVTEAARRSIVADPNFREIAATFNTQPLNEQLAATAVHEYAAHDARVNRIATAVGTTLGVMLELAPVPDALLSPDISNSSLLRHPGNTKDKLVRTKLLSPASYEVTLKREREQAELDPGVTKAEKELVAKRYKYGRDVKLLGLMAELHDNPISIPTTEDGIISRALPSGTIIEMTAGAYSDNPSLLDPAIWQKRRQLKDRVYAVQVDGKEYIMKERKTTKHTDTRDKGHVDGLTSRQEIAVARDLSNLGTLERGDIALKWEKPLGNVEFPDGYQFGLFESEPDLAVDAPYHLIEQAILAHKEEYAVEFASIQEEAKQILATRGDIIHANHRMEPPPPKRFPISSAARRYKESYKRQTIHPHTELQFEEFAALKASLQIDQAIRLLKTTMLSRGYTNNDHDGYGFKLTADKKPALEIIGFDFEYYSYEPAEAARILKNRQLGDENGEHASDYAFYMGESRGIKLAAAYAMLDRAGIKTPQKEAANEVNIAVY